MLNGALNKAVREGILQQNPMKMLDKREKFQPSPEEREFLTIEELRNLIDVPCANEQVNLCRRGDGEESGCRKPD